jgi:phenylpropionate dioxygenase-like ring-hydroxylating dioxygenase large terminal subunit
MWTALATSDEVAPGAVVAASAGELDLAVWRTHAGRAHVSAARCPHAFNHFAAVGVVDGDDLVCTAHFWRFAPDGTGCRLLTDGTREPMRDLGVYAVRERAGMIEADLPGE